MLSQQDTANTYDLYSNFSSDGEVGDEGDLQVRFSNNTTNEPGLKPSLNTNLHDEVAVLRKVNLHLKTEVEILDRRVNFILTFLEISNTEERLNMAGLSPETSQHTSQHTDIHLSIQTSTHIVIRQSTYVTKQ